MPVGGVERIQGDGKVVVEKLHRKGAVGLDAADPARDDDGGVRLLRGQEPVDRRRAD